jgi:hypothetical protein
MKSEQFPEFMAVVKEFAVTYEKFDAFQKNDAQDFVPRTGDQKTGVIGEAYIFEYLKRGGQTAMRFGPGSEKSWDIEGRRDTRSTKTQVRTSSSFSKTRTIQPIHHGWNSLYLISLDSHLVPNGVWIVRDSRKLKWAKEGNGVAAIKGMKMKNPAEKTDTGSPELFNSCEDVFEDFQSFFPEVYAKEAVSVS